VEKEPSHHLTEDPDDLLGAIDTDRPHKRADDGIQAIGATAESLDTLREGLLALEVQQATTLTLILRALQESAEPLQRAIEKVRQEQKIVHAFYDLPQEVKAWLLSLAAQGNTTPGQVAGTILSQHMSWHQDSFIVLFKGTEELTQHVLSLAHGRGIGPEEVVLRSIRFAWENACL